ncbi:unnamed protein product [Closterium sp. Yama58-4]|nr:unnamed protein product [Closterium sp. Yama58-4]
MVVATLYTWQADPLFLAAEEVQDSADRLQSSFHQWQLLLQRRECGDEPATWQTHPENDNDGDSIWPVRSGDDEDVVVVTVDQQVDEEGVRLVMLCACDTLRWQLEAFERAARDDEWRAEALGQAPSSVNETRERRRQFVSAIRAQLQQVQAVIRPAIGAASPAADAAVASGSSVGSSSAVSGVDSGGITVAFPSALAAAASNASSRAAAAAAEAVAPIGTNGNLALVSPSPPSSFRATDVSSGSGIDSSLDSRLAAPTRALDGSGDADVASDNWLRVRQDAIRVSLSDEEEDIASLSAFANNGSPGAFETSQKAFGGELGGSHSSQSQLGGSRLGREHSDSEHAPLFGGGATGGAGNSGGFGPETGAKAGCSSGSRGGWWGQHQQRRWRRGRQQQQQPTWQCLVYWLKQIQRPGEGGAGGAAGGVAAGGAGGGWYGEKEKMGAGRLLLDGRMDMAEMELGLLQLNNSQVAQMNAHWPAQRLAEEDEDEDQRQGSAHDDDAGENQRLVFGWQLSLHQKKQRPRSKAGGKGGGRECDGEEESEGGAVVLMGLNGRELVTALVAIVGIFLLILLLLSWCGAGGAAQQASSSPSLPPPND